MYFLLRVFESNTKSERKLNYLLTFFRVTWIVRTSKAENVQSIHSSVNQLRKYFKDCKAPYHINKKILGGHVHQAGWYL